MMEEKEIRFILIFVVNKLDVKLKWYYILVLSIKFKLIYEENKFNLILIM